MNLRRTLAAATAGLALAGAAAFAPASAAPVVNDGTDVTFTLSGSTLAISTPADRAAVTGSVAAATQITSSLGTTTVTDNTGSLLGWQVTATATDLSTGGANPVVIPKANMRYAPANLVASIGGSLTGLLSNPLNSTAVVTPGAGGPFLAANGTDVPVVVAVAAPGAGAGSYNITGDIVLTVPLAAQAGTYTATVTQTVT